MARLPQWVQGLGNTTDGLFIVDRNQHIVLWNKGAQRLLGHAERDVLGRPCHEVIAGRTPAGKLWCSADCPVQRSSRKGRTRASFDLDVRDKAGRERRATVSVIFASAQRRPLTVHLIRPVQDHERDAAAMDGILGILDRAGYLGSEGSEPSRERERPAPAAEPVASLTRREVEILSLVADGHSTAEIADLLTLSRYTVRNHIQSALRKLGLHTTAQAVSYAYKNGLV